LEPIAGEFDTALDERREEKECSDSDAAMGACAKENAAIVAVGTVSAAVAAVGRGVEGGVEKAGDGAFVRRCADRHPRVAEEMFCVALCEDDERCGVSGAAVGWERAEMEEMEEAEAP